MFSENNHLILSRCVCLHRTNVSCAYKTNFAAAVIIVDVALGLAIALLQGSFVVGCEHRNFS